MTALDFCIWGHIKLLVDIEEKLELKSILFYFTLILIESLEDQSITYYLSLM